MTFKSIRATLESLAYQSCDVIRAMEADTGTKIRELHANGGASANDFLMQFHADLLNVDVIRPQMIENTALAAVYLAGLAVGFYAGQEDICQNAAEDQVFCCTMEESRRSALMAGWKKAVQCALHWAKEE